MSEVLYIVRTSAGKICCKGSLKNLCASCRASAERMAAEDRRCATCGGVKAAATKEKPKWVMPDGRTDWDTYWASMPESLRDALGLTPEDLAPRATKATPRFETAAPAPDLRAAIRAAERGEAPARTRPTRARPPNIADDAPDLAASIRAAAQRRG